MKKKLIGLIASLSIAFGLTTSAFSKNLSYEEKRVQQYKQFYEEYYDKDYRIRKTGWGVKNVKGEDVVYDWLEIEHGKNLHDNKRSMKFSDHYDAYLTKIDKDYLNYDGPDDSWYYSPYTSFGVPEKAVSLESLNKENLPQVIKDILTLPEDLQKKVRMVIHYIDDGDSWIMLPSEIGEATVRKIFNHLNKLDEERDAKQTGYKGQIQPVTTTENQFLPMDVFFPPTRYVDVDKDGKLDYAVDLYCTNGSWFDPDAEFGYVTIAKWYELDQNSPRGRTRKHDLPFKVTIDFDVGKEGEQPGHDIAFFDEGHDGYFERYELLKGSKK